MTADELAEAAVDRLLERMLGRFADRATLTVEEAAELLGLGRASAYEACRTGRLPAVRLGRRVVIGVPALAALLLTGGVAS